MSTDTDLRARLQAAKRQGLVATFSLTQEGMADILTTKGVRYRTERPGDALFVIARLEGGKRA